MSDEDDIKGYLQSDVLDRRAAYAARGRIHRELSSEKQIAEWCLAFEALADRPHDPDTQAAEDDLAAEFALRRIERPWELVNDAVQRLFSNSKAEIERLQKEHPERGRAGAEWFNRELEKFRARRKRSS
jgi:hypothetical protein